MLIRKRMSIHSAQDDNNNIHSALDDNKRTGVRTLA